MKSQIKVSTVFVGAVDNQNIKTHIIKERKSPAKNQIYARLWVVPT